MTRRNARGRLGDMISLQAFIDTYGYLAILVGCFLEGETILILGGLAAHSGYIDLSYVILAAFFGTLCGDQLFFFLGRWRSDAFLKRRPSLRARVAKAQRLLDRFKTPILLGFRFFYGLRTATPFVIGMSDVPTLKFVFLNAAGALIWAIAVGTGGYLFGNALEIVIGNIKHYEIEVFGVIAGLGVVIWIIHKGRRKRDRMRSLRDSNKTE
jgi:membrane protein DedA with SNARE-associated domain